MNLLAAGTQLVAQAEETIDLVARRANLLCQTAPATRDTEAEVNAVCREVFRLTENRWLSLAAGNYLDPIVRAIIILLLAYVVNRVLKRIIKRFIRGLNERGIERLDALARKGPLTDTAPINLQRTTMRTQTIGGVLHSLTAFVVGTLAVLMILGSFGFNLGPLIAGAGIAGVALGFGAQSLVKDFLSGVFMLLEDQYGVGDIVDVGEAVGTVDAITLRATRIRSINGTLWHVPNGEIRRVGNMSQLWSRALLDIGVAYDTDIHRASQVIRDAAMALKADEQWRPFFFDDPEVWGVQELAADEITIRLVAKVTPAKQWAIERELRARIKDAFDAEGIEIPFPQRTVWVRQDGAAPERDTGTDAPWFGTQSGQSS
jgi:small conductance mechanosensitive channel